MRKKFEDLTKDDLWKLRSEIILNSLFVGSYRNTFGFDADSVCTFFDGYVDYLWEQANEDHPCGLPKKYDIFALVDDYDNADNLFAWYYCCDDYSWFKYDPEWTPEEEQAYADYHNGTKEKAVVTN